MATSDKQIQEAGLGIDIGQNLVTAIAAIFVPSGAQLIGQSLGSIARTAGQAATGKQIPSSLTGQKIPTVLPNGKVVNIYQTTKENTVRTVNHDGSVSMNKQTLPGSEPIQKVDTGPSNLSEYKKANLNQEPAGPPSPAETDTPSQSDLSELPESSAETDVPSSDDDSSSSSEDVNDSSAVVD